MTGVIALTPQLRRVRALNASPLTGTGTNTYVLGDDRLVIIDPGPDLDSHLATLRATIAAATVAAILVTHAHLDHSALAPRLARLTQAPILAFGPAHSGQSPTMQRLAALGLTGDEGADLRFHPDETLRDGAVLQLGGMQIVALHTPGHMGCHLCYALGETLFSGDHVMGWSTTLVSPPDGDMTDYMGSLARLSRHKWQRFFPGHGDPIDDPAQRLADLTQHRRAREAAILAALTQGPATPASLAARIYHDTPSALIQAATRNVLAHLIDLTQRGLTHPDTENLTAARFHRS